MSGYLSRHEKVSLGKSDQTWEDVERKRVSRGKMWKKER